MNAVEVRSNSSGYGALDVGMVDCYPIQGLGGPEDRATTDDWQERFDPEEAQTREDCRQVYEQVLNVYRD